MRPSASLFLSCWARWTGKRARYVFQPEPALQPWQQQGRIDALLEYTQTSGWRLWTDLSDERSMWPLQEARKNKGCAPKHWPLQHCWLPQRCRAEIFLDSRYSSANSANQGCTKGVTRMLNGSFLKVATGKSLLDHGDQQHHSKGKAPKTAVRFVVRKKFVGCSQSKQGFRHHNSGNGRLTWLTASCKGQTSTQGHAPPQIKSHPELAHAGMHHAIISSAALKHLPPIEKWRLDIYYCKLGCRTNQPL